MADNPFDSIEKRFNRIEELLIEIQNKEIQPSFQKLIPQLETEITFDITGLAMYLNCSKQTIFNLKKDGILDFYRLGRKIYFKKSEVDAIARVSSIATKRKGAAK